jgi:acyl-CoA hydrolase
MNDVSRLKNILRPGDHILWGQGTAEPTLLTEALVAQRHVLGPLSVFVGVSLTDTLMPEHTDTLKVTSYGALGTTRRLAAAGVLEILPHHVSKLGSAVERGHIGCDVAMVQLSLPGPNGRPSLGPINDYMRAALRRARAVIVQVNEQLPWTFGPELPPLEHVALTIETSRPPVAVPCITPSAVERAIAAHASAIIPDGATLQVGIGGTIDALLQCLSDRRDLGIHSGTIGDGMLDLIENGVVTNARKPIDRGVSITASLFGGERLMRAANRNPAFEVHPYEYTHSAGVLARIPNLVAVNSALEVDLTGQVNAEVADGRYIGAIGGQVDFMHAATRAPDGCSIIAIPSTAAAGKVSRIRTSVETVTCARSEVDFVVTEHGVADLRCQPLRERIRRMLAIAHPDFRETLEREAHGRLARGY